MAAFIARIIAALLGLKAVAEYFKTSFLNHAELNSALTEAEQYVQDNTPSPPPEE